jgi:hypothetical protein
MISKPKANSIVTQQIETGADGNRTIVFNVRDPKADRTVGTLRLELQRIAPALQDRAMIHGWIQRIGDAAAIQHNKETGLAATPADKFENMRRLVEHYNSGSDQWSPSRASGGTRIGSDESLLAQAIAELKPESSPDAIRAKVHGMTRAQRLALMEQASVKPIIERLRGEQVQDIDADELLSGL